MKSISSKASVPVPEKSLRMPGKKVRGKGATSAISTRRARAASSGAEMGARQWGMVISPTSEVIIPEHNSRSTSPKASGSARAISWTNPRSPSTRTFLFPLTARSLTPKEPLAARRIDPAPFTRTREVLVVPMSTISECIGTPLRSHRSRLIGPGRPDQPPVLVS